MAQQQQLRVAPRSSSRSTNPHRRQPNQHQRQRNPPHYRQLVSTARRAHTCRYRAACGLAWVRDRRSKLGVRHPLRRGRTTPRVGAPHCLFQVLAEQSGIPVGLGVGEHERRFRGEGVADLEVGRSECAFGFGVHGPRPVRYCARSISGTSGWVNTAVPGRPSTSSVIPTWLTCGNAYIDSSATRCSVALDVASPTKYCDSEATVLQQRQTAALAHGVPSGECGRKAALR